VNLFVPSEVTWTRGGSSVKLVQETSYPEGDVTAISVQTAAPATFSLGLRVPGWLDGSGSAAPEIRVNGVKQRIVGRPGTFELLTRTWKNGDRVEMHLPQGFRTEAIDESHPNTVALLRGPVLYAGLDSTGTVSTSTVSPGADSTGSNSAASVAVEPPRLVPGGLVPAGGTGDTYVQSLNEQRTVFVPFYRVQNESYNLYLQQT
jgi:DUF1680 family protein